MSQPCLDRRSGLRSLPFGVVVPDPGALLSLNGELPIPLTQIAARRVVACSIDARTALYARASFAPHRLISFQRLRNGGLRGPAQYCRERDRILDCLICP